MAIPSSVKKSLTSIDRSFTSSVPPALTLFPQERGTMPVDRGPVLAIQAASCQGRGGFFAQS
jgi:hypothetical protein